MSNTKRKVRKTSLLKVVLTRNKQTMFRENHAIGHTIKLVVEMKYYLAIMPHRQLRELTNKLVAILATVNKSVPEISGIEDMSHVDSANSIRWLSESLIVKIDTMMDENKTDVCQQIEDTLTQFWTPEEEFGKGITDNYDSDSSTESAKSVNN